MDIAGAAAVVSTAIAALSVVVAIRSNRKADRSNEIAARANEIAEETSRRLDAIQAPDLVVGDVFHGLKAVTVTVTNKGQSRAKDVSLQWENPRLVDEFPLHPDVVPVLAEKESATFSCKCTVFDLADGKGALFDSADVVLTWTTPLGEVRETTVQPRLTSEYGFRTSPGSPG